MVQVVITVASSAHLAAPLVALFNCVDFMAF